MRGDYRIANWLPLAVLGAAVLVVFWHLLVNRVLFWGPPALQYFPWREFAYSELSQGRLPFWNPYSGGGTPLVANYQSAIFYPPNWLHLLVADARAINLLAIGHVLWAGLGMWLLTRDLGLTALGRGVSLLVFALGSYYLGQLDDLALASTAAWLPWLFWATLAVLDRREYGYVGLLAIFAGLQLLAGHLQTSWYSFLAVGAFAVWYALWPMRPLGRGEQLVGIGLVILGILIGAGIASGQLILTGEFLLESHRRGGVDFPTLAQQSFEPWRFITLLMPRFFGSPADGSYLLDIPGEAYGVAKPYIGVLPLISVAFAVRGWLRRRALLARLEEFQTVPFWLGLSVVGFGLALGRYMPLYRVLYEHVPTFDGFRGPERWLIWPAFGLALLAGIGVHHWPTEPQFRANSRRAVLVVVAVTGLLVGGLLVADVESRLAAVFVRGLVGLAAWLVGALALSLAQPSTLPAPGYGRWQIAVLIFVAIDLGWATMGDIPTVPLAFYERNYTVDQTQGRLYWDEDYAYTVRIERYFDAQDYRFARENWAQIRTSLLPNLNIVDRVPTFNSYDALQPALHRQYIELIENAQANLAQALRGAAIGEVYGTARPRGWEGDGLPYIAPTTPPQAWLVPQARWVTDPDDARQWMPTPAWNPAHTVVIQADLPPPPRGVQPYPRFSSANLDVIRDVPGERRYRIQSDGGSFLVVATTAYPGWTARVNGQPATLYRANLSFMAVEVPPGDVEVVLAYQPTGAEAGAALGALSLFGALLIIMVDRFRSGYRPG